jgi:Fe2+ or Zn2+ uptake regulation protein
MDAHQKVGPVEAVATAILAHLETHPLAADSADGVARWWLGTDGSGVTLKQVEQALDLLVSRQMLRRLSLVDGTRLYSQSPSTRQ